MFIQARTFLRSSLTESGRQAMRNLGWLTAFSLIGQCCAFASVLLMTDVLGRDRFGQIVWSLTLQTYLLRFGCFGIKQVIVREGAQDPGQADQLFSTHFLITGCCSTLGALLAITGVWFHGELA